MSSWKYLAFVEAMLVELREQKQNILDWLRELRINDQFVQAGGRKSRFRPVGKAGLGCNLFRWLIAGGCIDILLVKKHQRVCRFIRAPWTFSADICFNLLVLVLGCERTGTSSVKQSPLS